MSAILATAAVGAVSAFAANPAASPMTQTQTPPDPNATPEPPEGAEDPDANEPAEAAEVPDANEPAEGPEAPGDMGHADDPADANADHQFEGNE